MSGQIFSRHRIGLAASRLVQRCAAHARGQLHVLQVALRAAGHDAGHAPSTQPELLRSFIRHSPLFCAYVRTLLTQVPIADVRPIDFSSLSLIRKLVMRLVEPELVARL
jgi:hypothetical protein